MNNHEIEELEFKSLLDLIKECYGYDFGGYAKSSIKRRITQLTLSEGHQYISELIPKILYEKEFLDTFLKGMSVTVTEMFRDPWIWKTLREEVIPRLRIFPRLKIWHAGCATGQEVYSMAILLKEEGLLDHSQIYATDFNNSSLEIAQKGIYPLREMRKHTSNYIESGGKESFSDYYTVKYDAVKFNDKLKENIVFSNHNLVEDNSFGEMNLIICRNVLIYFKQNLQDRALNLFKESLSPRGFLLLGDKESIDFSIISNDFVSVSSKKHKIFQIKGGD
ncbi:MAG: protein-glutamate O-methyltransferase CheR [Melioribacteraceae bacterium]|nr:protein-glutamate O-methyltransferase CheR [Melioribacteraceae bacterium]